MIKRIQILCLVPIDTQKYRRTLKLFSFYLVHSQIWLNLLIDDGHFDYITKLTPKKHN